ncbi:MAG: hisH [Rickettsiales bacterium]|jgi:glutamine amidotransferase|nr:hisH [Rickettsiales bacterium]
MTTSVVIIDYGSGNLRSAAKSLERAAEKTGRNVVVSSDPKALEAASHIVLPGVGAFADCMKGLQALPGMIDGLEQEVRLRQKPFLGICVGMQLLATRGFEHGTHAGLGWIPGDVVALTPKDPSLKVPHMGWNALALTQTHPVLKDIHDGDHAYFVHSYHLECKEPGYVAATVEYGTNVTAMVIHDNIIATQFHPEKSQKTGLALLTNFLTL